MFSTHYDGNDDHFIQGQTLEPGDTDRNGNQLTGYDQTEAESLERLVEIMKRENIIYIKGVAYQLESYHQPTEDGHRVAMLKVYRPF